MDRAPPILRFLALQVESNLLQVLAAQCQAAHLQSQGADNVGLHGQAHLLQQTLRPQVWVMACSQGKLP